VKGIGITKVAIELGVPKTTLFSLLEWNERGKSERTPCPKLLFQWVKREKIGDLDTGIGTQTLYPAMTLAMEIQKLRAENKLWH